jgi:hypothetical protein
MALGAFRVTLRASGEEILLLRNPEAHYQQYLVNSEIHEDPHYAVLSIFLLGENIPLDTLFSHTLNEYNFFRVRLQASSPYKISRFLYFNFIFLDRISLS